MPQTDNVWRMHCNTIVRKPAGVRRGVTRKMNFKSVFCCSREALCYSKDRRDAFYSRNIMNDKDGNSGGDAATIPAKQSFPPQMLVLVQKLTLKGK